MSDGIPSYTHTGIAIINKSPLSKHEAKYSGPPVASPRRLASE